MIKPLARMPYPRRMMTALEVAGKTLYVSAQAWIESTNGRKAEKEMIARLEALEQERIEIFNEVMDNERENMRKWSRTQEAQTLA